MNQIKVYKVLSFVLPTQLRADKHVILDIQACV